MRGARSIDRGNRARFTLLGLLLLVLGVVGFLLVFDVLQDLVGPVQQPSEITTSVRDVLAEQPVLTAVIAVIVGLLLLAWGLRMIVRQVPSGGTRLREVRLAEEPEGATTIQAGVVAKALASDLCRVPDVHSVSASVVGAGEKPHVVVHADVDEQASLGEVRRAMEPGLERVTVALGVGAIQADLHVKPVATRRGRVT